MIPQSYSTIAKFCQTDKQSESAVVENEKIVRFPSFLSSAIPLQQELQLHSLSNYTLLRFPNECRVRLIFTND